MRRIVLVTAVGLLAATAAVPASARNELITPGVGIGPIKLGMTVAQVRKALGRPVYTRGTDKGFGRLLIEYSYWTDGYTVYLLRAGGKTRVVSVETTLRAQKTRQGLGVGSTERQLRRVYRGLRCKEVFPPGGGIIQDYECTVGPRQGRQTVFVFSREPEYPPDSGHQGPSSAPQHVDWVVVKAPT
jgi:hypothetical protein